jgi:methionyl-tRNA formyltransferase
MRIIIANSNPVYHQVEQDIINAHEAILISGRSDLKIEKLQEWSPDFIFFLHWSEIIPQEIFLNFKCIVFHMTDLPFGRGGSPLQNLIERGYDETMISALIVEKGIDTGPILLKKHLSLQGTAEEIFLRAGEIMKEMIAEIIVNNPDPVPQKGSPTIFKRRTPEQSNLQLLSELKTVYDFIRMLDAEGYPKAFLETEHFRFEFSRASLKSTGILADVKIIKKK